MVMPYGSATIQRGLGGFGTGVDAMAVLTPQQRMQAFASLLSSIGGGLLSGRNFGEGLGAGIQAGQQSLSQGVQDRQRQQYVSMQQQEYEQKQAEIRRQQQQQQAQQAATAELAQSGQYPGFTPDVATAFPSLGADLIKDQIVPKEPTSEFAAWVKDFKAQNGKMPTMADINAYRQAGKADTNVTVKLPAIEDAFQSTIGKEEGTQAADVYKAGAQAASSLDTVSALRQAREALKAAGGDVGKLAPLQAQAGALMQSMGFKPEDLGLPADAGPAQVIDAMTNKLALSNIGAQSGGLPANNFSEADRKFITQMEANLGDNPSAYDAKLLIRQKVAERNAQAAAKFQDYPQTQAGWHAFQKDWREYVKANPLFGPQDQQLLFGSQGNAAAVPAPPPGFTLDQ